MALYRQAAAADDPDAEYWLLYDVAFSYLIERFDSPVQERQVAQANRQFDALSGENPGASDVEQVLALDLLSPFALWRLTEAERLAGRPVLPLLLGGALLLEDFPPMWDEALRAANTELPGALAPIIGAIKRHCREEFISFLYEDDFVDVDFRTSVLAAFEQVPDVEDIPAVARAYESYDDETSSK
ncbi:hypothetical protein [Clavibacter sepedonicus]|uniref:hypothetical protein n=1 Tax=Clavibacter sepedonicus TaxID=31964 RepID=UPI0010550DD1|nr:hypothetical protein [Clavibacter sepedonicus]